MSLQAPQSHYIDKRADHVASQFSTLDPDTLICTAGVAKLIGYSTQWLEIGRHRGYGPAFIRLGPRRIRYRVADIRAWLDERKFRSTAEYPCKDPR